MKRIITLLIITLLVSCSNQATYEEKGAKTVEYVYESSTNLGVTISKYVVDSVVYIVAQRREGIAIIRHGIISKP